MNSAEYKLKFGNDTPPETVNADHLVRANTYVGLFPELHLSIKSCFLTEALALEADPLYPQDLIPPPREY